MLSCYLRKGIVYLPTMAKEASGIYRHWEPSYKIAINDTASLKSAFREVIERGSPLIPNQPRGNPDDAEILKHAGVKTFSAFAQSAQMWSVEDFNGVYTILPYKKGKPRGWVPDRERKVEFPLGAPAVAVCDRLISMIQTAAAGG